VSRSKLLLCDEQTARQYGRISQQLRKKGRPIPQNDMWIAALALQHGLTLVTRDAHFSHIDGLLLQDW
jgi:tRNA(fMet)-specific endonuclease VapC